MRQPLALALALAFAATPAFAKNDTIVFVDGEEERASLEAVLSDVATWYDEAIVTEVEDLDDHRFWTAEAVHHDYFANNPQNPYCGFVVAPKVNKVRAKHAALFER